MSAPLRLLLLARPKGAWLVGLLPVIGYGYGLWERGSLIRPLDAAPTLALLWASWVAGHAGTMWLNAVLDRDEGTVLLGRAVPVPRGTAGAGYVALVASVAIAAPLGTLPAGCAFGCAVLAVLYSHPHVALKGHPWGGPLVNVVGYGSLSPIAGWAASEPVPTWRAAVSLGLFAAGTLGAYLAAQAFQQDEDRRRGYRTLVALKGPRWTLGAARACLGLTSVGLAAGAVAGAYPRMMLVAVPALVWADVHVARWRQQPGGGDGRWASGMVGRVVLAVLLVVGAAYVHHLRRVVEGEPGGGLGTAIVPAALDDVEPVVGR